MWVKLRETVTRCWEGSKARGLPAPTGNFGRGPHLRSDKGKFGSESLREKPGKESHEGQKRRLPGAAWANWG